MTLDEFAKLRQESKSMERKVDRYKKEILEWLEEYRDLSAAQIYNWLQERYRKLDFKDRTLRLYVNRLRKEYDLSKIKTIRQYEEIDEFFMEY